MRRIKCWLLGHRWGLWKWTQMERDGRMRECHARECARCDRMEVDVWL